MPWMRAFVPALSALSLAALTGCTMIMDSPVPVPGEVVAVAEMPQHCAAAAAARFGVPSEQLLVRQPVGTSSGYVLEGMLGAVAFSCFYASDGRYLSIASAAEAT